MDTLDGKQLLTNAETARILRISPGCLEVQRSRGVIDIPFVKVGRRIFYKLEDIYKFIDERTERPNAPKTGKPRKRRAARHPSSPRAKRSK